MDSMPLASQEQLPAAYCDVGVRMKERKKNATELRIEPASGNGQAET